MSEPLGDGWHMITNKRGESIAYRIFDNAIHTSAGMIGIDVYRDAGCTIEAVEVCDKDALAAQAAEHAEYKSAWLAMVREIANLDEVINPDDAMGQADDGDLLEHFDPWQTLREVRQHIDELEKQAAEHAAALARVKELEELTAELQDALDGMRGIAKGRLESIETLRANYNELRAQLADIKETIKHASSDMCASDQLDQWIYGDEEDNDDDDDDDDG